jgi:phosphotriesterase-related protein
MTSKIQTVLGMIDAEDLGVTLPHEHLFNDLSSRFTEPKEVGQKQFLHEPVSMPLLSWLRHNPLANIDNLQLYDEDLIIEERMHFKKEGGNSIYYINEKNIMFPAVGVFFALFSLTITFMIPTLDK